ncbi:hypothetical protein BLA3211_01355 [Burkholderia aenigmatica]|uniref:Anti-sigma factor n=2 Tax=Burkholderia TaxID=32008 RepID=A0A6J5IQM9_9BURK|nr:MULTISPECIES: hypothetical protein [Burkholderia]CAB3961711.1 hypothetical protein BLA3211_01355 [Burkholderia aenigmatica]
MSNAPRHTTDPDEPDRDLALAYMRGELTPDEHARFVERLAHDAALRDTLDVLEAAADIAQEARTAATNDAAFARLQAALGARDAAHARTAADAPRGAPQPARRRSWFARVQDWMREHSLVMQPALTALVVVQAVAIVQLMRGTEQDTVPDTVVRGTTGQCTDVWVTFRDGVTEQAIRQWLTLYGSSIVAGPDGSGRYRIASTDADARTALLGSSEAARLAAQIDRPQGCAK